MAGIHDRSALQWGYIGKLSRALSECRDLDDLLALAKEALGQCFPNVSGGFWLFKAAEDSSELMIEVGETDNLLGRYLVNDAERVRQVVSSGQTAAGQLDAGQWLADPAPVYDFLTPVIADKKVQGLLYLYGDSSDSFQGKNQTFIEVVAGQVGQVLAQRMPSGLRRQQAYQLEILHGMAETAGSVQAIEPTVIEIYKLLGRAFDTFTCFIALYDEDQGLISFPYAVDYGEPLDVDPIPIDDPGSMVAWVIRHNQSILTRDWPTENTPFAGIPLDLKQGLPHSILCVPMRMEGRVIGALSIQSERRNVFDEADQHLLSAFAGYAAVAVTNARLFADAQRRLRDMSALVDMAKQVTGALEVEAVMQTTVQILQRLLGARASSIALLDNRKSELVVQAAAGIDPKWVNRARMKVGEGVSGQAVIQQKPIYIKDTHAQPDFLFFSKTLRSILAVPLVIRDEVIGALTVDSDQANAFDEADIQLMTIAAAQVSVAIANARLYEEAQDRAAKLAVAYAELKESDRLKDELVQNVSHELRTPLTFIKGYVDLLLVGEMGLLNEEQAEALDIVSDKTNEVTRLVDDIMSLQRIETGNLVVQPFSLTRLVEETLAGYQMTNNQQDLRFEFFSPEEEVIIEADRGRVNQVLDNLIGNAVKFSPYGGQVRVEMEEDAATVTVAVMDEGIGVPSDKLPYIFERFYQADGSARRRFGGAGIGLAIVKRIIDAHAGHIWAESEPDQGSVFYFTLPKQAADGAQKLA